MKEDNISEIKNYNHRIFHSYKYSTKIIKATALISKTYVLLDIWNLKKSEKENVKTIKSNPSFSHLTQNRKKQILTIFKLRYIKDPEVLKTLIYLKKNNCKKTIFDLILYYYSAISDNIILDSVIKIIYPLVEKEITNIPKNKILKEIFKWIKNGKTFNNWSNTTAIRVEQNLIATLREFGLISKDRSKKINTNILNPELTAFIAMDLKRNNVEDNKILNHKYWKLFLVDKKNIEQNLKKANNLKLLNFNSKDRKIDFSVKNLKSFAVKLIVKTKDKNE